MALARIQVLSYVMSVSEMFEVMSKCGKFEGGLMKSLRFSTMYSSQSQACYHRLHVVLRWWQYDREVGVSVATHPT